MKLLFLISSQESPANPKRQYAHSDHFIVILHDFTSPPYSHHIYHRLFSPVLLLNGISNKLSSFTYAQSTRTILLRIRITSYYTVTHSVPPYTVFITRHRPPYYVLVVTLSSFLYVFLSTTYSSFSVIGTNLPLNLLTFNLLN